MWIGEQITAYGIGNGISLIIFAGIVARLPDGLETIYQYIQNGTINMFQAFLFAVIVTCDDRCRGGSYTRPTSHSYPIRKTRRGVKCTVVTLHSCR